MTSAGVNEGLQIRCDHRGGVPSAAGAMVSSSHRPTPPFQPGCVNDVSAECERVGMGEEVRRRRGSRASRLRWSKAATGPKVTRSGMARRRYIGLRILEILAMWRAWREGKRESWMASVIGDC